MNLNDVEYQKFSNNTPLITKNIVFEAIKICHAIKQHAIDCFKVLKTSIIAPMSIYIAALEYDKAFKKNIATNEGITMEKVLKIFNISKSDIKDIDENLMKKYYDEDFKIIIYNVFLSSVANKHNFSLKDLSYEYLTFYIHEPYISDTLLIRKILNMRSYNTFYISKIISNNLLNEYLGIDFPDNLPDEDFEDHGIVEKKDNDSKIVRPDFKDNTRVPYIPSKVGKGSKVLKLQKKNSLPK